MKLLFKVALVLLSEKQEFDENLFDELSIVFWSSISFSAQDLALLYPYSYGT
jgi:hypothetical protein